MRALLALSGTNLSRAEIAHRLDRFYQRAACCAAPEAHRLAETIEAWWPAIEARDRHRPVQLRARGSDPPPRVLACRPVAIGHDEGYAVIGWLEARPHSWRDQVTHAMLDLLASMPIRCGPGLLAPCS